jgi:hypothetical protein
MENEDYQDFIIADNDVVEETTEEVANPQIDATEEVETTTENTIDSTGEVETEKAKEITETQRVSQRINEARQQAKDEFIASQGYEWNGKPITTEAQYNQAMAEQAENQRRAELEEKGIDPKYLDDAVENNPTVKQAKELLAQQAQERARQQNFNDFMAEYPNVKAEQISKETWELVNQGKSLVDAYARQEAKELKEKLKVYSQNDANKKKAPISKGIAIHGSDEVASEDDFMEGFNSIH